MIYKKDPIFLLIFYFLQSLDCEGIILNIYGKLLQLWSYYFFDKEKLGRWLNWKVTDWGNCTKRNDLQKRSNIFINFLISVVFGLRGDYFEYLWKVIVVVELLFLRQGKIGSVVKLESDVLGELHKKE
eukprot:TRINITY_DN11313_c0_g1_i1.p4 TRINITY_DN11313_c0_g1~~TRINITY_DN11313_c0_g1_i1.p4  ORF type:complete len:128 (-),score=16.82 TRINITY_DN11313_c0_g1_i1:38-421(-)